MTRGVGSELAGHVLGRARDMDRFDAVVRTVAERLDVLADGITVTSSQTTFHRPVLELYQAAADAGEALRLLVPTRAHPGEGALEQLGGLLARSGGDGVRRGSDLAADVDRLRSALRGVHALSRDGEPVRSIRLGKRRGAVSVATGRSRHRTPSESHAQTAAGAAATLRSVQPSSLPGKWRPIVDRAAAVDDAVRALSAVDATVEVASPDVRLLEVRAARLVEQLKMLGSTRPSLRPAVLLDAADEIERSMPVPTRVASGYWEVGMPVTTFVERLRAVDSIVSAARRKLGDGRVYSHVTAKADELNSLMKVAPAATRIGSNDALVGSATVRFTHRGINLDAMTDTSVVARLRDAADALPGGRAARKRAARTEHSPAALDLRVPYVGRSYAGNATDDAGATASRPDVASRNVPGSIEEADRHARALREVLAVELEAIAPAHRVPDSGRRRYLP